MTATGLAVNSVLSREEGASYDCRGAKGYPGDPPVLAVKKHFEKKILGNLPISVIRTNTPRDFQRLYDAGVTLGNGTEEGREKSREFLMATTLITPTATPPDPSQSFKISQLTNPEEVLTHLPQLCQILQDCVDEGSSIGFLSPLSIENAEIYWKQVSELITKGNLHLFILTSEPSFQNNVSSPVESPSTSATQPTLFGTVQLVTIPKVTHFHRAEVIKLLVSPSARRLGIARKLMKHVEDFARGTGRDMLTLDTATESPAVAMYRRLGWEEWGTWGSCEWESLKLQDRRVEKDQEISQVWVDVSLNASRAASYSIHMPTTPTPIRAQPYV
ncbi:acyl-CoA N-acyltransferase [Hyaloscypha bicolor E]|uniref:Acyl-CoA N-acyltransferase n=1 Tax=Hyaloscypha bicolor E TaxID=1095630 RepID=A0A2J6TAT5_9HELO|nr:acyl-CoA N-acyltransferase [Hyaloscypha bicolor E]PMD60139.1 acyl-CoA N-acyltransferase [Hyaloscypha bicolor E]